MDPRLIPLVPPALDDLLGRWGSAGSVPAVSVICHVYNQRSYVEAALASVLAQQTLFPFEVIVRDDASSDGTADVVREYAEAYPNVVRAVIEEENTFIHGIKPISVTFPMVRGRYVAFCEGDDYWVNEHKLQMQHDLLAANPGCGAVHSNYYRLVRQFGAWRWRPVVRRSAQAESRQGRIYPLLLAANTIQTCTFMCRFDMMKKYRESGPGVDSYPIGDWPLYLYIAHESDIAYIDEPLAVYRKAAGSITNSGYSKAIARAFEAAGMIRGFCEFFGSDEAIRIRAEAAQYRSVLWSALRAGDRRRFGRAWNWLEKHDADSVRRVRAKLLRAAFVLAPIKHLLVCVTGLREQMTVFLFYRRLR